MGRVFQTLADPPSRPNANRQNCSGLETLSKTSPGLLDGLRQHGPR